LQQSSHRQRFRERRVPFELLWIQTSGELAERQRVALCRRDESVRDVRIDPPARGFLQQRARVGFPESANLELRQEIERIRGAGFGVAEREEHHDRIGVQAAGDEGQDPCGLLVEPVGVIDHEEQRLLGGCAVQQRQYGKKHQERVGRSVVGEPEDRFQRVALGLGQVADAVEERQHELVDRRETERDLGLHPGNAGGREILCVRDCRVEQRRLADPGRPAQNEHATRAAARAHQETVDRSALCLAIYEHLVDGSRPST
jgi:hypothetical protein